MKLTTTIKYLSLSLVLCAFVSCKDDNNDDDLIIDYSPVNLIVEVLNPNGENLLNPATPGNILEWDNYIYCDNRRYTISEWNPDNSQYQVVTRAYFPKWYGARIILAYQTNEPAIAIGEFNGGGSGTAHVLLVLGTHTYDLSFTSKVNGLNVDRQFYLDGKKQDSSLFKIVIDQ